MAETRVTVYASSSRRTPAAYLSAAAELGEAIAAQGWILVDGAGNTGCMGALNRSCIARGGRVEGVILQRFQEAGLGCTDLHRLQVTATMRERKRLLAAEAAAFVALPGGPGTFEEFWETVVERQIGTHAKPLVLVNVRGYYDGLLAQMARAADDGMLYGPAADLFAVVPDVPSALLEIRRALAPGAPGG